jgi:hypothetical protein
MNIKELDKKRFELVQELKKIEETAKQIKEEIDIIDTELIRYATEQGLESIKINNYKIDVKHHLHPKVNDWEAVYSWIKANNRFDILKKELKSTTYAKLIEDGIVIAGTEPNTYTEYKIHTA